MRLVLLFLFAFLIACSIKAVDYNMFNHIGASAHSIGLAGIPGFEKNAHAIFDNPASIDFENLSFSSFFSSVVDNENKLFAGSVGIATGDTRWVAGYMLSAIDGIFNTKRDTNNIIVETDSFNYTNELFHAGFQHSLGENFSLGFTANYYSLQMGALSGSGVNANTGFNFRPVSSLNLSVFAKNIFVFSDMDYSNGTSEKLPLELFFSFQNKMPWNTELYGQISSLGGPPRETLKSVAVKYTPDIGQKLFFVSVGYQEFIPLDTVRSKMTIGLGIEMGLNVYFAYHHTDYQKENYFTSITLNL
ncbi:MAG: hypothetical protein ACI9BD_000894 [Candidatus Marinamargulisbacteria bacterium]|jgi:hypothetical protein